MEVPYEPIARSSKKGLFKDSFAEPDFNASGVALLPEKVREAALKRMKEEKHTRKALRKKLAPSSSESEEQRPVLEPA